MESIEELNKREEFKALCDVCRSKCKDHTKICLGKRFAYALAKTEYKKRVKKGLIKQ